MRKTGTNIPALGVANDFPSLSLSFDETFHNSLLDEISCDVTDAPSHSRQIFLSLWQEFRVFSESRERLPKINISEAAFCN